MRVIGWPSSPVCFLFYSLLPLSATGIYTHSKWVTDSSDAFQDGFEEIRKYALPLAIDAPRLDIQPHKWFDPERERGKLAEISAKLKVELNAPVVEDSAASRIALAFAQRLKEDVAVSHRLNAHIQKLNARIQAQPLLGGSNPFSLLEGALLDANDTSNEETDWAYCTCGSGENGTLTFADRNWPGVELPTLSPLNVALVPTSVPTDPSVGDPGESSTTPDPSVTTADSISSLLQVTVKGRHLSIPRADKCDCANPWEGFADPASTCSLNKGVTICLVRVNSTAGVWTPEKLALEAQAVLQSIDATYQTNSFMELWNPFQFQL